MDVYEIYWRRGGGDLSNLRLFPVLQQTEGLRDGVSTALTAFDQQVKRPHVPREHFCKDLLRQMKQWREAGKRLVLCLDANENIYRAALGG